MESAYTYFPGFDMYEPRDKSMTIEQWQKMTAKQSVDYSIFRFNSRRQKQILKINRLMDSYNGIVDENSMKWLNTTYGQKNLSRYVDYRLARTKVDLIRGEWLKRPLNATVYTINKEAQSEKLKNFEFLTGANAVRPQLDKLAQVGYDVLDGMQVPQPDPTGKFNDLDIKTKNEVTMQYLLNSQIQKLDIKTKLSENYLDCLIAAECYSKTYIDDNGYLKFRDIDIRDALYEEIERDPFLLQSPYLGERRVMFIPDILTEFTQLEKHEIDNLYQLQSNPTSVVSQSDGKRNNFHLIGNNLAADVYTIEWYAIKPFYTKVSPDKNGGNPFRKELDTNEYLSDAFQKRMKTDVKAGRYTIETRYKKVLWEATRIGQNIYTNCREKTNIIANIDNPFETTSSYTGCLVNSKDGTRISLQESIDNIARTLNVTMFQINRELSKAKGKIVAYDRAYLPKGKTMVDVLHRMTNDGIYDYNSAEDGNISGAKIEINGAIKEIDLGVSATMQILLTLKVQLESMADRLSGVNEQREGNIASSATVGNTQSALESSRTITEPMNYIFDRYTEMVLMKVAELTKIVWTVLHPEEGENIVGTDGIKFLRVSKDLLFDAFGTYLGDSRKEHDIRQLVRNYIPMAINAGELAVHTAIEFELQETLGEAIAVVKKGWEQIQQIKSQEQENNLKAQAEQQDKNIEQMIQNREDIQQQEKDMLILEYKLKGINMSQQEKNSYITKRMVATTKGPTMPPPAV